MSLTVSDIEKAIDFYTSVMGAELEYRMGPFDAAEMPAEEDGRDWSEAHINVSGARLQIAMLKITDNLSMEMIQYENPVGRQQPAENYDVGSRHLCLEVNNLEEVVAYLSRNGCTAMSAPILMQGAPCPDSKSWYVLDPFDNQLELVEYL
ncbi:VOC family protein [Pseudomaricurvus alkylphenolicus]|uniref:VOC family protein n=1 Tax=Pseudomaricurvus alkylphenolicus TaxID=1306991 RepID=UPI0030B8B82A